MSRAVTDWTTVQAKATAAIEFCLSKGIAYTFWSEDALNLLGVN